MSELVARLSSQVVLVPQGHNFRVGDQLKLSSATEEGNDVDLGTVTEVRPFGVVVAVEANLKEVPK